MVIINECPRRFVGAEVAGIVNIAGMCRDGILPHAGPLTDQSAWFVDLWSRLQHEVDQIESERMKRGMRDNG